MKKIWSALIALFIVLCLSLLLYSFYEKKQETDKNAEELRNELNFL